MPRKKDLPYKTEGDIFATTLRGIMKERDTNQTKLSAQILEQHGQVMQRQTISQYMNGQSKPDTERLTLLCKTLNVSADYLLGLSHIPSFDDSLRAAGEYTGLSQDAVEELRKTVVEYGITELSDFLMFNALELACRLQELAWSEQSAKAAIEEAAKISDSHEGAEKTAAVIHDLQITAFDFAEYCRGIADSFKIYDLLREAERMNRQFARLNFEADIKALKGKE